MPSLDDFAAHKLAELERSHLRRALIPTGRLDGIWTERGGRRLLSFCCNDYLGLTHHPALKAAAIAAIEQHGVGAGASRLVTGNHPLYAELEHRLARLKHSEAACVFGSGYLTNSAIAPVLVGDGDLILIDELSHSSLWTGARLSRAATRIFRHNEAAHVAELLAQHRANHGRALIVTESVFSMDGDRAPVAELAALADACDAWLMVDDAHDLDFDSAASAGVPLRIGTLSKALGSDGGYVCG
jgi:8-amino-7-oxononanoate synthase